MSLELVPSSFCVNELTKKIMAATLDVENEWFFGDGAFNTATSFESVGACNTWLYERYVALYNKEIIACFDGMWSRPVDIITNFNRKYGRLFAVSCLKYLDYLFVNRGCMAFNWSVALQNKHALSQYERFVTHYCGHRVGLRTHAQKSYTGKISDIYLYEISRDEYFAWKSRTSQKPVITVGHDQGFTL
jgi:hypothetical protein